MPDPGHAVSTTGLSLGMFSLLEAQRMCISELSACTRDGAKLCSLFNL